MRFLKKVAHALVFAALFVWQLPQNLVALCILLFSGKVHRLTYRNFCFCLATRLPKAAGGVSLGNFAIVSKDSVWNERTVRHELDGHTVDSKIFGPLYLFVVGLPSLLHLLYVVKFAPHKDYDDFYTERWANRHAGLKK